ncbi:hypothetical protein FWF74_00655 [Candidatus Saccharibacteria bacterium]|nr:hypothetical protein [Candidatus Saccharibacteria bacterium]MCL1963311.1 hypothetical protein [Candidatus Saccharibacteria bacterium]
MEKNVVSPQSLRGEVERDLREKCGFDLPAIKNGEQEIYWGGAMDVLRESGNFAFSNLPIFRVKKPLKPANLSKSTINYWRKSPIFPLIDADRIKCYNF